MKIIEVIDIPLSKSALRDRVTASMRDNPECVPQVVKFDNSTLVSDLEFAIAKKCYCRHCHDEVTMVLKQHGFENSSYVFSCPECYQRACDKAQDHRAQCSVTSK